MNDRTRTRTNSNPHETEVPMHRPPVRSPRRAALLAVLAAPVVCVALVAAPASAQGMPQQDVVVVPAIGEGLCVHNLFQSNMVLQRDRPIAIWGWAKPGEAVTVSFDGEVQATTAAADRAWRVTLKARPASSTPTVLTVAGAESTLTLDNVLLGDVWLLAGQSNMEFPLERVDNGWLEIVSARFPDMRILTVPAPQGHEVRQGFARLHEWSDWFHAHFEKGNWDVLSPEIARELSAIGYVFARRIHMASRIPIGVVDVSRGGTTVETWTPETVLRGLDAPEVASMLADWDQRIASWDAQKDLANRKRDHEKRVRDREKRGEPIPADWKEPSDLRPGPAADQNRPGACYNSMIAPIAGLAVKGAIFHQGYNNALGGGSQGAAMYARILPETIRAWRAAFGDPQMPFGILSLCTEGPRQSLDNYCEQTCNDGIYIREAHYQTFVAMRANGDQNVGFASCSDLRRAWYHPQQKIPAGERMARWALATQYGESKRIRWLPPTVTRMEAAGSSIVLHFDGGVAAEDTNEPIEGFAIAGEDRRFQPARAVWLETGRDEQNRPRIDRRALVLSSPLVPQPIHFRYAWGRSPMGNLQSDDHNDLPFPAQRSDDWKMEEVPLGVLAGERIENGRLSRPQRAKIVAELKKDDLRRRLAEAKALLEEHGK